MAKYTTEDLLLYIYGETTDTETDLINEALTHDWDLREKYDVLINTMETLNKMIVSPRAESVNAILKYAGVSVDVEN